MKFIDSVLNTQGYVAKFFRRVKYLDFSFVLV